MHLLYSIFLSSIQDSCAIFHLFSLQLTNEDLRDVEEAIENLGVEKRKLIIEEQALSELKSEMADYQEDIEDFRKVRSFANYKVC